MYPILNNKLKNKDHLNLKQRLDYVAVKSKPATIVKRHYVDRALKLNDLFTSLLKASVCGFYNTTGISQIQNIFGGLK